MSDRLSELYRKLSDQGAAPDAEALARLAAGDDLGADRDALLAQVAESRAAADALAIALAISDNAAALARAIAPREARVDVRHAGASYRRGVPLPWLAAAAAIAVGFALMLEVSAPVQPSPRDVASDAAVSPGAAADSLSEGSFEPTSIVAADSFESDTPPELFSDDFDA
ncbi:MAG TPA: hypothetical protein VND91_07215 [Candidatus Saccharimonadia bacterium]|nr:hypothetical protein [Candidatus Saccharimonadia bacterium]